MKRLPCLAAMLFAFAFSACGGDDEPSSTAGASETSGTQGASSGSDLTARQFNDASIPDEVKAVDELAAANGDCDGIAIKSDRFRQGVFIDAVQAAPDTLISEIVAAQCSSGG